LAVREVPAHRFARRCRIMFIVLMLVTYIPSISLWLPHLLSL
jgi:TRAP-type C4-dicarboxylate transport system permease large subunit